VTLIGGNSAAKAKFLHNYLGTEQLLSGVQTSAHKFSVLLHNNQPTPTTLPGTALDVDPRYPFYRMSEKIEKLQSGAGSRVNSYMELKTLNSEFHLKGKLFIDAPNINDGITSPVISLLMRHSIENGDLVLVFTDVFETITPQVEELIETIKLYQDTNKFIYLLEETAGAFPAGFPIANNNVAAIATWQRKLADLGLNTGQFIVLSKQQPSNFAELDQRMINVGYDRIYRILDALDKNIYELENVVIPEVGKGITLWKERVNMSSLIVLGFVATIAVFAEIEFGIVITSLIDPIIGPIVLIVLAAAMMPLHLLFGKAHAKAINKQLGKRQKELHLIENIAGLFEKSQSFSRMILPITEPASWNKKTKARLHHLSDRTRELVRALNDNFASYVDSSFKNQANSLDLE
jgi:hypothetical protein